MYYLIIQKILDDISNMFVNKEAFSSKITADMLSRCFNSIEDEVARNVIYI